MKKLISFLVSVFAILSLSSCNNSDFSNHLSKYINNEQLIELTKAQYDEKLLNGDDFVLFIKMEGCSSCSKYYPIVASFLNNNPDKVMYCISFESLGGFDVLTFASNLKSVFGDEYYNENEYLKTSIPTPSTIRINNRKFEDAFIGVTNEENISKLYVKNFYSYSDYYSLSRKISIHDNIKFIVSTKKDDDYAQMIKDYFASNKDHCGYYLDASELNYNNTVKFLNRINIYLGKENEISTLPDYIYIEFENEHIINFITEKLDYNSLFDLYANN